MVERLRFWWQNRKGHSLIVTGIIIVLLALIAFIFATYRFGWSGTGFLNKTLWDWLQLFIIPLALAGVALLFNLATTRRDQQIALDKQRGDLLQAYLDRMSELLLEKKLRSAKTDDEVRDVVRVRTTTVLCQLDGWRVGYVFVFLHETGLMSTTPDTSIVSLVGADFRSVNWSHGYLTKANLSGVNLSGANLRGADLTETNLSDADLGGADLSGATGTTTEQLKKARSLKDTTLPDGSKHHERGVR